MVNNGSPEKKLKIDVKHVLLEKLTDYIGCVEKHTRRMIKEKNNKEKILVARIQKEGKRIRQQLQDKDRRIAELESESDIKDRRIAELERDMNIKERRHAELERERDIKNSRIDKQYLDMEREGDIKDRKISQLESELTQMAFSSQNSSSMLGQENYFEKENESFAKEAIKKDEEIAELKTENASLAQEVKNLELNYKGEIMKVEKFKTSHLELTKTSNDTFRRSEHKIYKLEAKVKQLEAKSSVRLEPTPKKIKL